MNSPSHLIEALARARVLLIGDVILDEYRWGTALGLSAETPTIVARDDSATFSLGGAGLLCRNLLALEGQVKFISLVGDDEYRQYTGLFQHPNLTKVFLEDPGRKTTVKSRFWVGGYKLLGWDRLDNRFIGADTQGHIVSMIRSLLPSYDKLIVSDYRHGLITETLAHSLVELAKEFDKPLYIDSQVSQRTGNHRWFTGASLFCVNEREALTIDAEFDSRPIEASLTQLQKTLQAENVVVKLGEQGYIALLGTRFLSAKPPTVEVRDTTGAGDAFFAVLSLSPEPLDKFHLEIANTWAALSTTIDGAQPPTLSMLTEHYRKAKV